MNLLEDAHKELESDLGEEITHYLHVDNQEGDFWQDEGEWDRTNPSYFHGIVMSGLSDDEQQRVGISDTATRAVRTTYSDVDEKDLLVIGSSEWAAESITEGRLQGSRYVNIIGLVRHYE